MFQLSRFPQSFSHSRQSFFNFSSSSNLACNVQNVHFVVLEEKRKNSKLIRKPKVQQWRILTKIWIIFCLQKCKTLIFSVSFFLLLRNNATSSYWWGKSNCSKWKFLLVEPTTHFNHSVFLLLPYYPLSSCQNFLPLISAPTGFMTGAL